MSGTKKYKEIQTYLKRGMQSGEFPVDSLLPSENEICTKFSATRTTVRKALEELLKEGYIEKEHGRGSRVVERRKSLGLLSVSGFSGSTDLEVETRFSRTPHLDQWDSSITFHLTQGELNSKCISFQRIRHIKGEPVVVENNWYSVDALDLISADDFVEESFFKTLSQKYHIEIVGVEQEIRAQPAEADIAEMLGIDKGQAILYISIRFKTSKPNLVLYGSWYCHTEKYPLGSSFFL